MIRGFVTDEQGKPVLSGRVRVFLPPGGCCRRPPAGMTGTVCDGAFVLHRGAVPPGSCCSKFSVKAPGHVNGSVTLEPWATDMVARGLCVRGVTVVLQRCAVVEGTAYLPDGTPAGGAVAGGVEDPFDRYSERATRHASDQRGRFRVLLDPRRRWWLHAAGERLLARPADLDGLQAGVTHRCDIRLEPVRRVEVKFAVPNPPVGLTLGIDGARPTPVKNGIATVRLDSGPHRIAFERGDDVLKEVRLWLEPHRPEHHEWVHLD